MRCWSGASSRRSCVAVSLAGKKRIDHQQLDLEFASTKKELDALQRELQDQLEAPGDASSDDGNKPSSPKPKAKPTGKRDLASCTLMPTQSIVIADVDHCFAGTDALSALARNAFSRRDGVAISLAGKPYRQIRRRAAALSTKRAVFA